MIFVDIVHVFDLWNVQVFHGVTSLFQDALPKKETKAQIIYLFFNNAPSYRCLRVRGAVAQLRASKKMQAEEETKTKAILINLK